MLVLREDPNPLQRLGTAGSPCTGVPAALGKDLLDRGWSLPRGCWRSPVLALARKSSACALHLTSALPG